MHSDLEHALEPLVRHIQLNWCVAELGPAYHDLFFLEPIFHSGLNVTVRKGDKWMEKAEVGDDLFIKKTDEDSVLYKATLVGKAFIPFMLIPDEWLAYEHDPNCRTREGLLTHGMKPAYPGFTETKFVTVLLFWIDLPESQATS